MFGSWKRDKCESLLQENGKRLQREHKIDTLWLRKYPCWMLGNIISDSHCVLIKISQSKVVASARDWWLPYPWCSWVHYLSLVKKMGATIGLGSVSVDPKSYGRGGRDVLKWVVGWCVLVVTAASEEKLSKPSCTKDLIQSPLRWSRNVSVDITGLGPELRAGSMFPSLDSISEVSIHGKFKAQNWNRPFRMLPDPLASLPGVRPWAHYGHSYAVDFCWLRWASRRCRGVASMNTPDCGYQPFLTVVSLGDPFTCCYSCLCTRTSPPCCFSCPGEMLIGRLGKLFDLQ